MTIQVVEAVTVSEGENLVVKRLMPVAGLRNFDPFVLWDHFDIDSGGFPDHPHRGFEAITYMFAGSMQHTDNLGNKGAVHGGGAQCFTAGSGIVHSEMPLETEDGHHAVGIQLWINLPKSLKGIDPAYQQVHGDEFNLIEFDGGAIKTIVGEDGPVTLKTEVEYLDVSLTACTRWERSLPEGFRGFIYLVEGSARGNGEEVTAGSALFVEDESDMAINAVEDVRFMWCFGKPHHEPIYQHGPFVD